MLQPIATLSMPDPVSWADEERNLSAWLGNDIQDDAFESLYRLEEKIKQCQNESLLRDWRRLQASDHFYYMCTKYFADGDVHKYFNPYNSPFEAFINYMNVLSDFEERINAQLLNTERKIKIPLRKKYQLNGKRKQKLQAQKTADDLLVSLLNIAEPKAT